MKSSRLRIFAALLVGLFAATQAHAQATLSTQGVLQRTTGMAVEDGDYAITFKLYTTESGGTPVWSETQSDVEVVGGVYGVQLGSVTPLNIPFDQVYYLGLTVSGGAEHFPRTKLTAAPYALSLLGQDNKFPSTGLVQMGALATGTDITTATSYTVGANDHVIYLDHTANQNVTLPAATTANAGRQLLLVNKEAVAKTLTSSNYVDVITGTTSTTIPAKGVVELQSDGSVWRQTGGYAQSATKATVYATGSLTLQTTPSVFAPLAPLSNEVLDIGSNFNNTTGVFTAPRTGNYQFSGFLGMGSRPNTQTIHYISLVNTAGSTTYPGTTGSGHSIHQYVIPLNYLMGSTFSRVVYMTAGSSVSLIYFTSGPITWDTGNSAGASLQLNIAEL